jgi:dsRNA-specific ribonuclease
LNEKWPDHDKKFEVWIFFDEQMIWIWTGSSKKKAEEKAAEDAYNKLTITNVIKVKKVSSKSPIPKKVKLK